MERPGSSVSVEAGTVTASTMPLPAGEPQTHAQHGRTAVGGEERLIVLHHAPGQAPVEVGHPPTPPFVL